MANELDLSLLLPQKVCTLDKLAESAAQIALHNFEWRYVTLLFYNSSLLCGLDTFVQIYNKSLVIGRGAFNPKLPEETRQYILFGTDIPNIVHMLQWMKRQHFDNTGRYIVICWAEKQNNCDETEAVKTFWNHKIINVMFIKRATSEEEIVGYTYFHQEDCGTNRPVRVNSLDGCIKNDTQCCEMFPMKFLNLHRCPIIVSTFIQAPYMNISDGRPSGVDGDLLLILAEGLNATLKVMTPLRGDGWGALDDNGTWLGSLGDVYDDVANFSITYAAITLNRFLYFQMSLAYNCVSLGWITHPTESLPSSLKLLRPIQPATQIIIGITFIFVIILAILTKTNILITFRRKLNMARPRSDIIFYSWTICMGLPIKKFPKKTALLCVLFIWIWYTFIIRTIYQTALINSLMNDQPYSNVETLEDLINAKYAIGGGPALKDYYIDSPFVYDNYISLNNSQIIATLTNVSKGMKFGLAINMEYGHKFVREHRGSLHMLRERILISPTVIYFKKFSPLTAPTDRLLRRLIEAGFPDQLYKNYAHTFVTKAEDKHAPIKLEHFAGCYAIILFGWFISTLFFIYEICVGKFKHKYFHHR